MRIAYLVHDYHRAVGHSRYVAELASRFAKEHEVHVFANRIERNGASGIHFHTVPAWRANALTAVVTFALPATFQPDRKFDIIHSQGFCGFRGNVFTGHICNRAWHLALEKLEGGPTYRERIFDAVATALEHTVYRSVRHGAVVAISRRVAEDLVRYYHCPAPIHVIHHGVDLELFRPANRQRWRTEMRAQYGFRDDETVFLFMGDMRKGAMRSIEALSKLERGRLWFVSRSETGCYRAKADEAGLGDRVVFAGPTDQPQKFYAAADAFVLPSPYDAFGMVVSEAMATGLPVIVSREAGASELIEHGQNGLLLEDVTSAEEFAQHMRSLANDPAWAAELGRKARNTVEPMTWDAVAAETMRVYREVVNSN